MPITLLTWVRAVAGLSDSSAPISALLIPRPTRASTSRSRWVSTASRSSAARDATRAEDRATAQLERLDAQRADLDARRARTSAEGDEAAGELARAEAAKAALPDGSATREQVSKLSTEAETRRAIQEIRAEVADLTVLATEKVTRKALTGEDQKRLVDEALSDLDFTSLAGERQGR